MANAQHDQNHVPTLTAVLNTDGTTIVPVRANPANNRIRVSDGVAGSNNGLTNAKHDGNFVPTATAVSSADGTTIVTLYADSSGNLLMKSS